MTNAGSKIKLIKTARKIGTTYCLWCKDYPNNFKQQEIKMLKCLEKIKLCSLLV